LAVIKAVATRQTAQLAKGIKYITNPEKTDQLGLVSGKDCTIETALEEMQTTKEMFDKNDGRQYKHFIQSFDPKDVLDPAKAHELGMEFAKESFPGHEVLVATHLDKDHIHNHFVVNSVNFETGAKIQSSKDDLKEMKSLNDRICEREGLHVIQNKTPGKELSMAEYQVAIKGESWKFKLMGEIDQSMEISTNKKEFIQNMEDKGYQVKWTDQRKEITYTTPDGKKSRGNKLHDVKYSKEAMENEFSRTKENQLQPDQQLPGGRSPGTTGRDDMYGLDLHAILREQREQAGKFGNDRDDQRNSINAPNDGAGRNEQSGNGTEINRGRNEQGRAVGEIKQSRGELKSGNKRTKNHELQPTSNSDQGDKQRTERKSGSVSDVHETDHGSSVGGAKDKKTNVAGKGEGVRIESPDQSGSNSPSTGSISGGNALDGILKTLEAGAKELVKQAKKHEKSEEKKREREEKRKEKDRGKDRGYER